MKQPTPVVRQIYWPAALPQVGLLAAICGVVWWFAPRDRSDLVAIFVAMTYMIYCMSMRRLFTQHHRRGMQAYRREDFREALKHFERSHDYFDKHRTLDNWRSVVLGVATHNPYRIMAMINAAFCQAHLGHPSKAMSLYEQVLEEVPDHTMARMSLNMLRPVVGTSAGDAANN